MTIIYVKMEALARRMIRVKQSVYATASLLENTVNGIRADYQTLKIQPILKVRGLLLIENLYK